MSAVPPGRVGLVLVGLLAATFGVTLVQVTDVLGTAIRADPATGPSSEVGILLTLTAVVFIVIALYVSGIVTSNTVATVVAGRRRSIALRRLIGSAAGAERRRLTGEGVALGAVGAVLGAVLGTAMTVVTTRIVVAHGLIADTHYTYLHATIGLPILAVVAMAWLASWHGSRRVLAVRPLEALANTIDAGYESGRPLRRRQVGAGVLVVTGLILLGGGVRLGLTDPFAVLPGLVGGLLSFLGIVAAADRVVPPVVRAVARLFGGTPSTRLAASSATQRPERTTRLALGLLVAVTLVTTFVVAMQTYSDVLDRAQRADPHYYDGTRPIVHATVTVFTVLIAFTAVIAAVGLVNNLVMDVHQRAREIGLLRAVGMTRRQVTGTMLAEAALLTLTATLGGLLLGIGYGWCGAQCLVGSVQGSPGLAWPGVPVLAIPALVVAGGAVTLLATVAPARVASRVSPILAASIEQ